MSVGTSQYLLLSFADYSPGNSIFRVLDYPSGILGNPSHLSEAIDGTTYTNLDSPGSIDIVTLDTYTYAIVTSYNDGVQIINVTTPDSLSPVLGISDNTDNYTALDGANDVVITTIGSSTYALVTSDNNDDGVQIIDITEPSDPIAVSAVIDGQDNFTTLDGTRHCNHNHLINVCLGGSSV